MTKILIDHNIRPSVFKILVDCGYAAESAQYNGWDALQNGELVKAAAQAGFDAILTQDSTFIKDGARGLKQYPDMAVILVDTEMLPQKAAKAYVERFLEALKTEKLPIIKGVSQKWPKNFYG